MMEDEVLITDVEEPASESESDAIADSAVNDFLNEFNRSQSQKKLDLIEEIELYVDALETNLGTRFNAFLQGGCDISFSEMSLFQNMQATFGKLGPRGLYLSEIDGTPLGCFLVENTVCRMLLSSGLTGKLPREKSDDNLSTAEQKLFVVFASLLATALTESFEAGALLGNPKKAERIDEERFSGATEEVDWVCLQFKVGFAETSEKFVVLVPLSLFTGEFPEAAGANASGEVVIDANWQSALFDQIEKLKVPLLVELGAAELPLSAIDSLQPGETLDLAIEHSDLKIMTEEGQPLLRGSLQSSGQSLEFRILEKVE